MNTEYQLIGLISENEVDGRMTLHELYLVFKEALQLLPMYEIL